MSCSPIEEACRLLEQRTDDGEPIAQHENGGRRMTMRRPDRFLALRLVIAVSGCDAHSGATQDDSEGDFRREQLLGELPVVAVWLKHAGRARIGESSSGFRVAIWADGRVLFSESPTDWKSPLRRGWATGDALAKLKADVVQTGVFDLEGHCYLVPDASVISLLANVDGRQQLLYWDEVETPGYGINIDPKPRHLAFKKAWRTVNSLALALRPSESSPWVDEKPEPPAAWYFKQAIQSE